MNPINLDNIVKYPLNGQCRICDKDFYTKFDGKVFHSYGAVCHEICVVHSPAIHRDPYAIRLLDIPVLWRDIRAEGDRCKKLICTLCKGKSANLGCALCPRVYHFLCGHLRGCKNIFDVSRAKSLCWGCVDQAAEYPALYAAIFTETAPIAVNQHNTPRRSHGNTKVPTVPSDDLVDNKTNSASTASAGSIIADLMVKLGPRSEHNNARNVAVGDAAGPSGSGAPGNNRETNYSDGARGGYKAHDSSDDDDDEIVNIHIPATDFFKKEVNRNVKHEVQDDVDDHDAIEIDIVYTPAFVNPEADATGPSGSGAPGNNRETNYSDGARGGYKAHDSSDDDGDEIVNVHIPATDFFKKEVNRTVKHEVQHDVDDHDGIQIDIVYSPAFANPETNCDTGKHEPQDADGGTEYIPVLVKQEDCNAVKRELQDDDVADIARVPVPVQQDDIDDNGPPAGLEAVVFTISDDEDDVQFIGVVDYPEEYLEEEQ